MRNQHLTDEEAEAVVVLWSERQAPSEAGPTLSDVAEALNITPAQAQELLVQVQHRQQQEGWIGKVRRTARRHPLARLNRRALVLSPAFSALIVAVFGATSLLWSAFSWEEWISFPISILEKAGLLASNGGLWLLFVYWLRSLYGSRRPR